MAFLFIQPLLLQGLFYGRKTCQRHHAEQADASTLSAAKIRATARHTHTCAMVGQRHSASKAIQQSAAMVMRGASYVLKCLSVMVIFARHAKLKDASRQLPTSTTSSTRQAVVLTISTTFRRFVSLVTRPKLKRSRNAKGQDSLPTLWQGCCRDCNHKKSDQIPQGMVGVQGYSPS